MGQALRLLDPHRNLECQFIGAGILEWRLCTVLAWSDHKTLCHHSQPRTQRDCFAVEKRKHHYFVLSHKQKIANKCEILTSKIFSQCCSTCWCIDVVWCRKILLTQECYWKVVSVFRQINYLAIIVEGVQDDAETIPFVWAAKHRSFFSWSLSKPHCLKYTIVEKL